METENIKLKDTKKKKRIHLISIFRAVVQLVSFIFLPSIFVTIYTAFKDIYIAITTDAFSFESLAIQIFILIAIIPVTILTGRFFCGFMCSFGAMGDLLWFISEKLFRIKFRISEKADKLLKYLKYLMLVISVVLIWTFQIIRTDPLYSPWTVFGMYSSIDGWQNLTYLLSAGAIILAIIMILSIFIHRFFCRYLCPLGAIFALLSRFRLFKIIKPREVCRSCKLCSNKCPMGIPTYNYDVIKSGECINCFICTANCLKHNAKSNASPVLISALAVTSMTSFYYSGNIAYAKMDKPSFTITADIPIEKGVFADGVYDGYAPGYKGVTEVQVIVTNGNISSITILSTGDDMEFFQKAQYPVINRIIENQSFDVAAVSGATFSSQAIINATRNALDDSYVPQTLVIDEKNPVIEPVQEEIIQEYSNASEYSDGNYTGSAQGYRGVVQLSVEVVEGKITDISVISHNEDMMYFLKAYDTVVSNIIETQNPFVSTVSGATYTSNALIKAVADALSDTNTSNTDLQEEADEEEHEDRPRGGSHKRH